VIWFWDRLNTQTSANSRSNNVVKVCNLELKDGFFKPEASHAKTKMHRNACGHAVTAHVGVSVTWVVPFPFPQEILVNFSCGGGPTKRSEFFWQSHQWKNVETRRLKRRHGRRHAIALFTGVRLPLVTSRHLIVYTTIPPLPLRYRECPPSRDLRTGSPPVRRPRRSVNLHQDRTNHDINGHGS
jgi:hypothetical protein